MKIKVYFRMFGHYVGYKYAKFKMWIFMQIMHIMAIFTKDPEDKRLYKSTYASMKYRFHRS